MKAILAVAAALMLAGCVSEQPATGAQLEKLNSTCRGYGFSPGTDAFTNCLYQLDQQRIASNYNRRMAVASAMGNMGAQMQSNAAYRRPVTCTSTPSSTWVGGPVSRVRTTCY